jgi:predicted DNA-binding antitoxin AbrB/MazE fold protein
MNHPLFKTVFSTTQSNPYYNEYKGVFNGQLEAYEGTSLFKAIDILESSFVFSPLVKIYLYNGDMHQVVIKGCKTEEFQAELTRIRNEFDQVWSEFLTKKEIQLQSMIDRKATCSDDCKAKLDNLKQKVPSAFVQYMSALQQCLDKWQENHSTLEMKHDFIIT